MMTDSLTGKMGPTPILPVRRAVIIDTMIYLDGDGHGDGDGTCKQPLTDRILKLVIYPIPLVRWIHLISVPLRENSIVQPPISI